jgi:hypothetical protein
MLFNATLIVFDFVKCVLKVISQYITSNLAVNLYFCCIKKIYSYWSLKGGCNGLNIALIKKKEKNIIPIK